MTSFKNIALSVVTLSMMFVAWVFAAAAPTGLNDEKTTGSSVTLSWNEVPNALGYYLYYGKQPAVGGDYDSEVVDLIEGTSYTVEDLSANTTYYFAVTSIDEYGSESPKSEEFMAETSGATASSGNTGGDFRVNDVTVVDDTTLSINFTRPLDTSSSASQEFMIQNAQTGKEIPVDMSQVDSSIPSSVIVVVGSELAPNTKYDITVLDIRDSEGNAIEEGINGITSFTTWSSWGSTNTPEEDIEMNSASEQEEETQEELPEDTAWEEAQSSVNLGNAGQNISRDEMDKNVTVAAEKSDTLPQTGPAEWILFMVALLIAGGVFFYQTRKVK